MMLCIGSVVVLSLIIHFQHENLDSMWLFHYSGTQVWQIYLVLSSPSMAGWLHSICFYGKTREEWQTSKNQQHQQWQQKQSHQRNQKEKMTPGKKIVSPQVYTKAHFSLLASLPNILSLPKSASNYELCKGTIQNEAQIFIIDLPSVSINQKLSHWQIALRAV